MFKRGERVELEITDFAFGGRGIAKISSDNQRGIIFVPNTYPGQRVKVMISAKKKKHYWMEIARLSVTLQTLRVKIGWVGSLLERLRG